MFWALRADQANSLIVSHFELTAGPLGEALQEGDFISNLYNHVMPTYLAQPCASSLGGGAWQGDGHLRWATIDSACVPHRNRELSSSRASMPLQQSVTAEEHMCGSECTM